MTSEKVFSIIIRLVFIFAFGAFLSASIHHIAAFFHDFEPAGSDWLGSYALAVSVDGTALMLTIGMMFFSKNMPMHARIIVWFFIVALTGFSWVVNWEYAVTNQAATMINNLNPMWASINPVLASSFAFLNLAYSIVSEFFGAKEKTVAELQAELDGLTGTRAELLRQINEAKPSFIQRAKQTALEAKEALKEVTETSEKVETEMEASEEEEMEDQVEGELETETEVDTEVELETIRSENETQHSLPTTGPLRLSRRKPLTIAEVAAVLKKSDKTVRSMRDKGVLKAADNSGKLITVASINALLAKEAKPGTAKEIKVVDSSHVHDHNQVQDYALVG